MILRRQQCPTLGIPGMWVYERCQSIKGKSSHPKNSQSRVSNSMMSNPALPPNRLSFLHLPPEIRNQIYTLLLTYRRTSDARLQSHDPCHKIKLGLSPSLLSTNRQIYTEASGFLYGSNMFNVHPSLLSDLPFALDAHRPIVSTQPVGQIRKYHIRVRLDCDPFYDANKVEMAFGGLEVLEVEVCQARFGGLDYSVLKLFAGVRGVRRARVYGSVSSGFARCVETVMMGERGSKAPPFKDWAVGRLKYTVYGALF